MGRAEKALELLERGAKLGLRVEFQSGMNILKETALVDPEVLAVTMEQLANYLPEIRDICQRRAICALGKTLVSRRIWSKERGEGTLVGASDDGTLTISIGAEMRRSDEEEVRHSQMSITCNAESLLVLDDTPAPVDEEPILDAPRKRIFGMF